MQPIRENVVDLDEYIDYSLMSGRPHIRGQRVDIPSIVNLATIMPVAEVADELSLTVPQVVAALLYYQRNRAAVDATTAQDAKIHEDGSQHTPKKFIR